MWCVLKSEYVKQKKVGSYAKIRKKKKEKKKKRKNRVSSYANALINNKLGFVR